jgi:hypothetical protein
MVHVERGLTGSVQGVSQLPKQDVQSVLERPYLFPSPGCRATPVSLSQSIVYSWRLVS